jgi:hypothetical protein
MLLEQLITEQLIVRELGPASDTGPYMKEKKDENDLSTSQGRPRTF